MRVYVITAAKPLQKEIFIGVRATKKEADKTLRDRYQQVRKTGEQRNITEYLIKNAEEMFGFVHEIEI